MALTYLATEKGLIDLRLPLHISIDTNSTALCVYSGMPHETVENSVVMRIKSSQERDDMMLSSGFEKPSEPLTGSEELERELHLLKLVALSLAEAIALTTLTHSDSKTDTSARILEFTGGQDWSWTLRPTEGTYGSKRANLVNA